MIATYGEIMLRLSPSETGERLIQATKFRIEPGGSESNVAISLAGLGNPVTFITKIPDNPLGHKIIRYLKQFNVETSYIMFGPERVGLYWTENGVGLRASDVIYDRGHSAFSQIEFDEIDKRLFNSDMTWFHVSGITPAVSKKSYETLVSILNHLDERCRISVDLNYRSKLWRWVEDRSKTEIHNIMYEICNNATLITGNETDFENSLGYNQEDIPPVDKYAKVAQKAFSKFQRLEYLAVSIRQSRSASENIWSGMLFCKKNDGMGFYVSAEYLMTDIIDRVGTGDSFTGGIIHGLRNFGKDYQRIIEFASALSVLNHSVKGDASQFTSKDIEHLIATKGSGRITR